MSERANTLHTKMNDGTTNGTDDEQELLDFLITTGFAHNSSIALTPPIEHLSGFRVGLASTRLFVEKSGSGMGMFKYF